MHTWRLNRKWRKRCGQFARQYARSRTREKRPTRDKPCASRCQKIATLGSFRTAALQFCRWYERRLTLRFHAWGFVIAFYGAINRPLEEISTLLKFLLPSRTRFSYIVFILHSPVNRIARSARPMAQIDQIIGIHGLSPSQTQKYRISGA